MIGAIEKGIVDRIKAANGPSQALGYSLRCIASYGNELDDDINKVIKQFPAVWVVYQGEPRPKEATAGRWIHAPAFAIVCCAKSLRNEKASRRGAGGEIGSYQIFQDVRALLTGQTLGLEISPIEPGEVRPIVNAKTRDKNASIYVQTVHTGYESNQPADAATLDDFATFHSDWDIPPHGNVTPPLPADEADAEDTVILETE